MGKIQKAEWKCHQINQTLEKVTMNWKPNSTKRNPLIKRRGKWNGKNNIKATGRNFMVVATTTRAKFYEINSMKIKK